MTTEKRLAKSTFIVSSGIMGSRVLGLIREILFAKFFGIGSAIQAFLMAFTIPNALRELAAEGAVNTALVPVLAECDQKKGRKEFWRLANVVFNLFLVVLLVIVIIGIFISPLLVRIIAPGFMKDPEKFTLTVRFTRILFPYILLIGLATVCMGILNTLKHFKAPAISGIVFNAIIIGGMLIFYPNVTIMHVVAAVIVGGIVQLLVQLFTVLKFGPFLDLKAGFKHEGALKAGKLLIPRMMGAGIYEVNVIVNRILASLDFITGKGAVAALYYGNRLFQLPLAVFGISLATAALPTMSFHAAAKDMEKLKETISFSLRTMLFFTVPAAVGLMVLSKPIVKVLFERGEFDSYATLITSGVLLCYSIGLVAYGGMRILVSVFYSMHDTVTPLKVSFYTLFCNIALNLTLMWPLKAAGLALATSIAGFINFGSLYIRLRRKIGHFGGRKILESFMKILGASFLMGFVTFTLLSAITWDNGIKDIFNLVFLIAISVVVYILGSIALRVSEINTVFSWIKKR
ncbi:MAG: murein biosynthesis integral membrane protein MurJ [Candidatus Omnitrophica bacterium]|nr:murein biosynthesis integral membrane protein MurJ [Candidatus Omnitrophota bacterium]MBU4487591.1 murein biosynthesis integral membrane protein MurJ [Candidatus Omnitrophota bacterium]MCG2705371.1 murein biosynthesis integral membrane protein MurJ [Candidatus Omnitrophota bacterium]